MNLESGPGKWLLIVAGLGFAGLVIAADHYNVPPVSTINDAQAWVMGGSYSPQLTFLIIILLALIPVGIVAAIVKAITGTVDKPVARRPIDEIEDVEPVDPAPRRRDDDATGGRIRKA